MDRFTAVELCAGAGGQALGLELAGFKHLALVEIDHHCCETLRANRPEWNVLECDLRNFDGHGFEGLDLLAGGLPCPPFSVAGKQLGPHDERNMFPEGLRLIRALRPRAIMFENVRGMLDMVFQEYRSYLESEVRSLGYSVSWRLLQASQFGVPQLRPRVVFLALRDDLHVPISWPRPEILPPPTIGECLVDLMATRGWRLASAWARRASGIAPTIVGGSKKHGGPDLGPQRAKRAWEALGVDAHGIAQEAPPRDFSGRPRLTVRMVARLQGFPDNWRFCGSKTAAYRQVGNAFPPPVAAAVASCVVEALRLSYVRQRAVA